MMKPPPSVVFNETGIEWIDAFSIGHSSMDDMHQDFVVQLDKLLCSTDSEMEQALQQMVEHLREHFQSEADLMERTAFPIAGCHMAEHDAVLQSASHVLKLLQQQNDFASVRGFALALRDWFPGHVTHLDSALVAWVVEKDRGGRPVVLHRGASTRRTKDSASIQKA